MAMRNINGAAISITDQHTTRRRRSSNIIDRLGVLCGLFAMSSIATSASAMSKALRLSRRASFIGGVVSSRNIASPSISVANRSVIQSTDLESSVPASALLFPSSPPISSCALYMAGRGRNSNVRESGRPSSTASASAVASSTAQTSSTAADSGDKQKQSTKKRSKSSGKKNKKGANTGRLRLLPPLQPANEILSRAMRQTYQEVKDDMKIANQRRRTQKRGAQTIDLLCQKLCAPLKSTVQTYRMELKHMHPFEKVVMDLTVRARQKKDGLTLSTILDEIHEGRKEMLQLSKDWIFKIKNSQTARESHECTEEAKEQLGAVFTDLVQEPWSGVMELQKSLRNVPIVRLDCPAVVLVGAPNVGKSSIVRAISSGTPEVNNYPFTTRGMTLGHVQVFWESDVDVARGNVAGVSIPSEKQLVQERLIRRGVKTRRMKEQEMLEAYSREKMDGIDDKIDVTTFSSESNESTETQPPQTESSTVSLSKKIFPISQLCQIMDSPGILRRDDPTIRNEMEELTLAAMAHLPTAVMYVMDLSGGAGDKCSSVEDQLILRRELRARFPRRPWIDVISKVDLGIVDGAAERLRDILEAEKGGSGVEDEDHYFIELSIKEGQGVDELRQEVMRMLGEVRVVLDAMAAMDERSARAV